MKQLILENNALKVGTNGILYSFTTGPCFNTTFKRSGGSGVVVYWEKNSNTSVKRVGLIVGHTITYSPSVEFKTGVSHII